MNRRSFFATVAAVFASPRLGPQPLLFHRDAFSLAMRSLDTFSPIGTPDIFITSGGQGYVLKGAAGETVLMRLPRSKA